MNEYIEELVHGCEQSISFFESERNDAEEAISSYKERINNYIDLSNDIKFYELPDITSSFFSYKHAHFVNNKYVLFTEQLKQFIEFEKYKKERNWEICRFITNFEYYDNLIKYLDDNNYIGIIYFLKDNEKS